MTLIQTSWIIFDIWKKAYFIDTWNLTGDVILKNFPIIVNNLNFQLDPNS